MSTFDTLKSLVSAQFDRMVAAGTLFTVDHDRDLIWSAYLEKFEDPAIKQEHKCNCCKSFIRQIGAVVAVGADNQLISIWDLDLDRVPAEYVEPVKSLQAYVKSLKISGLYYHVDKQVGAEQTPDRAKGVIWKHFCVKLPSNVRDTGQKAAESGQVAGSKQVLQRSVEEISKDSIETVLELIAQNSLYRGNDYKHMLDGLAKIQKDIEDVPEALRDNLYWKLAATLPETVTRVRNTAIGTLLISLSEGTELEAAVKSFERLVAPANYKRPTSLVTPRMIEEAKKRLGELGLMSALDRRRLDTRDLNPSNALFVHRPKSSVKDVFAELAGDTPVDPKTLSKVESISITDFIEKVLPTAASVRVLFERHQLGNLATLTGAVDPEANALFKWDNSFGWSYTGGVADSIKEKVKAAGGRVEGGWMRASLAWSNYDDLDLHFYTGRSAGAGRGAGRGAGVGYYNKHDRERDVRLDVDMNAGGGTTRTPVENLFFGKPLKPGVYNIHVNNYNQRETTDIGYDVEIEVNGEVYNFSSKRNENSTIAFTVGADGNVTFKNDTLSKNSTGTTKWNLKTGIWHTVSAITLSPNHWAKPIGNKHWFFLLSGAISDEKTRPFYNEFLCDALAKDRKVTEVLGGKIEVRGAEGAELSGLGFSETIRNHVYVEVEGKFKRVIKVTF